MTLKALRPIRLVTKRVISLIDFSFINLLCDGCLVDKSVGVTNSARDESGDDFGKTDDSETDESVDNDLSGFLSFVGVTSGSDISDTTVNYKNNCNNAGYTNNPLNKVSDHLIGIDTTTSRSAITNIAVTADKGDADGAHNGGGGHNNSETNKGVGESSFTGGDLTGVARRKDVKITTIDYVAENKIGGNNGDIGSDIGDDGPNIGFEVFFGFNRNAAIPRGKAEKIWAGFGVTGGTTTTETFVGESGSWSDKTKYSKD